jgi:hypothetical protein
MNAPLPATLHKFKVLSLDRRGDQFMVRMDLSQELGGQTDRLVDMDVLVAQNAKSRHNIRVTSVYWRMSEMVSVGRPQPSQSRGKRAAAAAAGPALTPCSPALKTPRCRTRPCWYCADSYEIHSCQGVVSGLKNPAV